MKFLTIVSSALSVNAAQGYFFPRRHLNHHGTPNPVFYENSGTANGLSVDSSQDDKVIYNALWAGAVLPGKDFASVTGKVVVGQATGPPDARAGVTYASTTWVGIDGTGCSTHALLQTGVDSYVTNGVTRYEGWWEWYPGPSTRYIGNFPIKLGDEIRMGVTATGATSGYASLENLTTGKVVNHTITSTARMCFKSAEWVVEDFYSNGRPNVLLANFTTVTFTEASATTKDGRKLDTTGSQVYGVKHNTKIYTNCSVPNSSTVTCRYA